MSTKFKRITGIPTEIYLSIVSYLGPSDLFSLILTCKSLSSIAYQQLYSNLHFGISREAFAGRGITPPRPYGVADDFHLRIPPVMFSRLSGTLHEQKSRWERDGCGIQFTKKFVLHTFGYDWGSGGQVELRIHQVCSTFGEAIEEGGMPALREVFLECPDICSINLRPLRLALEKRQRSDFDSEFQISLGLKLTVQSLRRMTRTKHSLLSVIDPATLTLLDVQFSIRNMWGEDMLEDAERLGLDTELGNAKAEIQHLVNVLSEASRLKFLRLENYLKNPASNPVYEIFEMYKLQDELAELQQTILGLEKLETLMLFGVVFHHSWFIVPPGNVRTLSVTGPLSGDWYREFAKHTLAGVVDLTIEYFDEDCGIWETSDGWELELGEVAVTGLKAFRFRGYDGPEEWVNGLIEKNKGLEVVRGDVHKEKMKAAGWAVYTKGEDEYWLKKKTV
ncbi:hypothetical protein TWF281_001154 [Arthrobotrys megalospora]